MGHRTTCRGRRKKPRVWALRPALRSMSWGSASEEGEKAVGQLALFARAGSGDEYRIVSRQSAHDLGPSGGVDGNRHALRGPDGGLEHGEIRTRGQAGVDELLEVREVAFLRSRRLRQH